MKRVWALMMLFITVIVLFMAPSLTIAQDPDTLDVPQGFETLNLAIKGDTTATGSPKNLNRVYRLERGGFYMLNGTIVGIKGAPLRVVAAKGDGPRPILVPAVTESGSAGNAFQPGGSIEVRGLYVSGIDNLGNQATKNMFRCDGKNARIIIDGCFLDHDAQTIIRMNAEGQKLYLINSILRNSILLSGPDNGRFIDTRGNTQDTLLIQNSTLYLSSTNPVTGNGFVKYFCLDHVTFYETGGRITSGKTINGKITNNLFMDYDFEGNKYDPALPGADSLASDYLPIDSLKSPLSTEENRQIKITNNVYGYSPQVTEMLNSFGFMKKTPLHNVKTQRIIDTFPNIISENNIEEYPIFSDAPDPAVVAAYANYRISTNFSNVGNPDPRADRNGMAPLVDNPASMGPALDEFDFDYNKDAKAYTYAEGGFPAGDLNWFPDKKAEWEAWIKTGVKSDLASALPAEFQLQQNYPNPFNPITTISYRLGAKTRIRLEVYNSLGQIVRTLIVHQQQLAGIYRVQWDGLNETGQPAASGLYLCRLQANDQVQTKKMVLMK